MAATPTFDHSSIQGATSSIMSVNQTVGCEFIEQKQMKSAKEVGICLTSLRRMPSKP